MASPRDDRDHYGDDLGREKAEERIEASKPLDEAERIVTIDQLGEPDGDNEGGPTS